jgi:SH3-like domain-containing protein
MKKSVEKVLLSLTAGAIGFMLMGNSVFAVTGTVTGSSVRIRKDASKSSEEVSVATKGEKVNVIGDDGDWYKVEFEDVTGYISKDYVDTQYQSSSSNSIDTTTDTLSSEQDNEETNSNSDEDNSAEVTIFDDTNQTDIKSGSVVQIENEVSLRNLPNFSSRVISTITSNTEVTVKEELNNWIKITDGTVTGWALKNEVNGNITESENTQISDNNDEGLVSDEQENQTSENTNDLNQSNSSSEENNATNEETSTSNIGKKGVVNVESAKIRTSPNGTIIDVIDLNDEVEIISEEDDWYKINVGDNKGCYIAKRLITVK